jgi:hypothetical protein
MTRAAAGVQHQTEARNGELRKVTVSAVHISDCLTSRMIVGDERALGCPFGFMLGEIAAGQYGAMPGLHNWGQGGEECGPLTVGVDGARAGSASSSSSSVADVRRGVGAASGLYHCCSGNSICHHEKAEKMKTWKTWLTVVRSEATDIPPQQRVSLW